MHLSTALLGELEELKKVAAEMQANALQYFGRELSEEDSRLLALLVLFLNHEDEIENLKATITGFNTTEPF